MLIHSECSLSGFAAVGSVGLYQQQGRGAVLWAQAPTHTGRQQDSTRGTAVPEGGCRKAFSQLFIQHGLTQQRINMVKKNLEVLLPATSRVISIHRMW